ncbi:MAG: hypothetical protein K6E93_10395 [Bacteroidales bacterium]|nr:hypothetical protein [Bacteroidales bacterium]
MKNIGLLIICLQFISLTAFGQSQETYRPFAQITYRPHGATSESIDKTNSSQSQETRDAPKWHDKEASKHLNKGVNRGSRPYNDEKLIELSFRLEVYKNKICIQPKIVLDNIDLNGFKYVFLYYQVRNNNGDIVRSFRYYDDSEIDDCWEPMDFRRDDMKSDRNLLVWERFDDERYFVYLDENDLDKELWICVNDFTIFYKGDNYLVFIDGDSDKNSREYFALNMDDIGNLKKSIVDIKHGSKKYSGEFSIAHGFDTYDKKIGRADYEYKDASDGTRNTRIFEGTFHYTYNNTQGNLTISDEINGNYLNNKQIGTWRWDSKRTTYYSIDPDKVESEEAIINFDDNGYCDGRFSYGLNLRYARKTIKGNFLNGRLESLYYFNSENKVVAKGFYSTTDPGTPIGKWIFEGNLPYGPYKVEYDNHGNVINGTYIDPRTGDRISVPEWIRNYPKVIYKRTVNLIQGYCYRSTKLPVLYQK